MKAILCETRRGRLASISRILSCPRAHGRCFGPEPAGDATGPSLLPVSSKPTTQEPTRHDALLLSEVSLTGENRFNSASARLAANTTFGTSAAVSATKTATTNNETKVTWSEVSSALLKTTLAAAAPP